MYAVHTYNVYTVYFHMLIDIQNNGKKAFAYQDTCSDLAEASDRQEIYSANGLLEPEQEGEDGKHQTSCFS